MKRQAKKIAQGVVERAREESKTLVAESINAAQLLIAKVQDANAARETEGRDAWSNLKRLGGQKLPPGDEVKIAQRLFNEMSVVKKILRTQGIPIGLFCIKARISDASESSKELHRLILPPGKDPTKVRLRRSASKYRSLIEAIGKITKESISTLADRILRGTSLHPANLLEDLTETEKVQAVLQGIVNKIDDKFHVQAKFREIAELKARHIKEGGTTCWPLQDPLMYQPTDPEEVAEYTRALEEAKDTRFAFWKRPYDPIDSLVDIMRWPMAYGSNVLQDPEFFYVPHAPLGFIEYANLPNRKESPGKYEAAVKATVEYWRKDTEPISTLNIRDRWDLKDDWDEKGQCPIGQVDPLWSNGSDFAWIVIYPMPDGARLMPMLYISHEEGGAYLLPLDARNLEIFREAIWIGESTHMSVFDRIKELLGYRPNSPRAIEDGLQRTAPWLDHNPFFKMRRQRSDDLKLLDEFCQNLWEEKK